MKIKKLRPLLAIGYITPIFVISCTNTNKTKEAEDDKKEESKNEIEVDKNLKNQPTIYIDYKDEEHTTFERDLKKINDISKIKQLGFYEESEGIIKPVKFKFYDWMLPKDFPSQINSLANEYWNASKNEVISNWDISNVTDMSYLFAGYQSIQIDLSKWNTKNVKNMKGMFESGWFGDEGDRAGIANWDVSNVTDMSDMFNKISGSLNFKLNWDTKNVENMEGMFASARDFNGDVSNFDTSNVTDMSYMFNSSMSFNQDISSWNVSNVKNMRLMFRSAEKFSRDISNWNVKNVTDMEYMISSTKINCSLKRWDVKKVKKFYSFAWLSPIENQWHKLPNFIKK